MWKSAARYPVGTHHPGCGVALGDLGPEAAHCGQRQVDVAARADVGAGQRHLDLALPQRRHHQERRHILAGQAGIDRHAAGRDEPPAPHRDRRAAGRRLDVDAQGHERVDQGPDRTLAHVGVAIDHDEPIDGGDRGGEEARGGAGVAEEERRPGRAETAIAGYDEQGVSRLVDPHPHGPESVGHQPRVVAFQRAREATGAAGETGQQQRAIGDALRPRRRHAAAQGPGRRHDRDSGAFQIEAHGRGSAADRFRLGSIERSSGSRLPSSGAGSHLLPRAGEGGSRRHRFRLLS